MKKGDISFREFSDLLISSPIFILSFLAVFEKNCLFSLNGVFLHFIKKIIFCLCTYLCLLPFLGLRPLGIDLWHG